MKARVKATGEIVEVQEYHKYLETGWKYKDNAGILYKPSALDFSSEAVVDYWEKLLYQYAGMAMQSYVSNNVYLREIWEMCKEPQEMRDLIADLSILLATTLVEKLKEKEGK